MGPGPSEDFCEISKSGCTFDAKMYRGSASPKKSSISVARWNCCQGLRFFLGSWSLKMTYFPNDLESCGFFGGPQIGPQRPQPFRPFRCWHPWLLQGHGITWTYTAPWTGKVRPADWLSLSKHATATQPSHSPGSPGFTGSSPFGAPLHLEQWASQFIHCLSSFNTLIFQSRLRGGAGARSQVGSSAKSLSDDQRRSATISVDVSDLRPQQMSYDRNALNALGEKSRSVFRCDDQRNFRKQTFRELELILHMGTWFSHVFTKAVHIFRHLRAYTSLYELHVLPEVATLRVLGFWAACFERLVFWAFDVSTRRTSSESPRSLVPRCQVSRDLLRCEVQPGPKLQHLILFGSWVRLFLLVTTPFKHTSRSYFMLFRHDWHNFKHQIIIHHSWHPDIPGPIMGPFHLPPACYAMAHGPWPMAHGWPMAGASHHGHGWRRGGLRSQLHGHGRGGGERTRRRQRLRLHQGLHRQQGAPMCTLRDGEST